MKPTKDVLKSFINSKSKFFDLPDGDSAEVVFKGVENVVTSFNGTKVNSLRYHFDVDGKEMAWDRTHRNLAKKMITFEIGDRLIIKRTGQRNQTQYEVSKID